MKITKAVVAKVNATLRQKLAEQQGRQRADQADASRQSLLIELKRARRKEMMDNIHFLWGWWQGFISGAEGLRMSRAIGPNRELVLFEAKFWRGAPCDPKDRGVKARLGLVDAAIAGGRRVFSYSEWYRGHEVWRSRRLICHQDFFDNFHPDFLQQLVQHLCGPDAWKYVELCLDGKLL